MESESHSNQLFTQPPSKAGRGKGLNRLDRQDQEQAKTILQSRPNC